VARDPDCPCCSQGRFSFLDPGGSGAAGKSTLATALCGRDEIQVMPRSSEGFSISALAARLAGMGSVEQGRHTIAFSDGELGFVVFADGRAIVRGAKDEAQAVSAYSEYIGI
jgi:adenylyltransferase/sulfurtransferase